MYARAHIHAHTNMHTHAHTRTYTHTHLVEVGVLGRSAVRGLEDGMARQVVDVAARRNANATNLHAYIHTHIHAYM